MTTEKREPMPFWGTSSFAGCHIDGIGGERRPTHEDMRARSLAEPPTCPTCNNAITDCNTGEGHSEGCTSPFYRPGRMAPLGPA